MNFTKSWYTLVFLFSTPLFGVAVISTILPLLFQQYIDLSLQYFYIISSFIYIVVCVPVILVIAKDKIHTLVLNTKSIFTFSVSMGLCSFAFQWFLDALIFIFTSAPTQSISASMFFGSVIQALGISMLAAISIKLTQIFFLIHKDKKEM